MISCNLRGSPYPSLRIKVTMEVENIDLSLRSAKWVLNHIYATRPSKIKQRSAFETKENEDIYRNPKIIQHIAIARLNTDTDSPVNS